MYAVFDVLFTSLSLFCAYGETQIFSKYEIVLKQTYYSWSQTGQAHSIDLVDVIQGIIKDNARKELTDSYINVAYCETSTTTPSINHRA